MRRVKIREAINNAEPKCTPIEWSLGCIRYIHRQTVDTHRDESSKHEFTAFAFKYTEIYGYDLSRTLTARYRDVIARL